MIAAAMEVWRGDVIESVHRLHIAVADASGALRAQAGDPALVTYARSAIKPLQALPLVDDNVAGQFGFGEDELALACASHSGETRHVEGVRSMLHKIGALESDLACGAPAPIHEPAPHELRRHGVKPGRVHNNCSGKHAGMLALARAHDWQLVGYHERAHPVQQRMLRELAQWAEVQDDEIAVAVDGCGVATFAVPVAALAGAFARLASAARRGVRAPAAVVGAMTRYPEMVGGTRRLCTQLMRVTAGRVFVKVGAEGVYCAGVPGAELGVALKVEDGAKRAAEPAIVHVLKQLGIVTDEEMAELEQYAQPYIMNTRNESVGVIRARIELEAHGG